MTSSATNYRKKQLFSKMCYVKQTNKNTKLENSVRDQVSVHELKRYFFKPQRKLYAAQTDRSAVCVTV